MLRSLNHDEAAYVRFVNHTERVLDLIWVNYHGVFEKYGTIQPGRIFDVNTYKTHPWLFVDRSTGEHMTVNGSTVYQPFSCQEFIRLCKDSRYFGQEGVRALRYEARISIPMRSLRDICLAHLLKCIPNIEDADKLDIPTVLITDMRELKAEQEEILSSY